MFVFLHLTDFTQHNAFKVYPCCCKCKCPSFSWLNSICVCVYAFYMYLTSSLPIHPWWKLSCFHVLAIVNYAAKSMGISAIKRDEMGSFVMIWMNLVSVIQSEVSQKKKNKYCLLTHIYMESRKVVLMTLFAGPNRDTNVENGLADTAGEGEDGMSWESSFDIHTYIWTVKVKSLSRVRLCDPVELCSLPELSVHGIL